MCRPRNGRKPRANRNEVPSSTQAGDARLPVWRLGGLLVGPLGEAQNVFSGDAREGDTLRSEEKLGARIAAGHRGAAAMCGIFDGWKTVSALGLAAAKGLSA